MEPPARRKEVSSIELFFLIARCLDGGPCQEAARVLRQELTSKGLLPKRKNWLGEDVPLSYEEAVSAAPHVSTDHLAQICTALQDLLRSHGYLKLPSLSSLLGSGLTSHITGQLTSTGGRRRGNTAQRCSSQLIELTAASRCQPIVNLCHLLCSRSITPSFSPSAFTGPRLYQGFKQHCSILGHLAPVYCVMFDRTGQRVITGADDDLVKIWGSDRGQLLATLRGHAAEVTDMSLSPDNTMIASGSLDKTVRVWCAQTTSCVAVLIGHTGHITSVQFSPCLDEEQRLLASTSKDGFVYFWTWNTENCTFNNTPIKYMEKNRVGDQTLCSAFSPGGKYFVTGGTDRIVRVYGCIPGPPLLLAEVVGHTERIMTIQFCHRTDSVFATGSCDATARVWRYREGAWQGHTLLVDPQEIAKMVADWGKDKPQVTMIGWECTDTYVVTAMSPDCNLRVYHSKSGDLVHTLKGHTGEVFVVETHPSDSRVLLSAGHDGLIILWNMLSGTCIKSFKLQHEEDQSIPSCIFDCRFSPGGSLCAAADGSGYLTLLGLGSSVPYQQSPEEQFFHTDYRPLMRDRQHFVVDEQSHRPPHLLPPPYLVDIDGHAHPARHQEALLRLMRPVNPVKLDPAATEECDVVEDYDEFMRGRLNKIRLEGTQFRDARSAMAQRGGAGGRDREAGGVTEGVQGSLEGGGEREGPQGGGAGGRDREAGGVTEGVQGSLEGGGEREGPQGGGAGGRDREAGGVTEGVQGSLEGGGERGGPQGGGAGNQGSEVAQGGPLNTSVTDGASSSETNEQPDTTEQGHEVVAMVKDACEQAGDGTVSSPRQLSRNDTDTTCHSPMETANNDPPPDETTNSGPSGPPPPPTEEPTVDVTSQQGRGQSVQNMLSSIVYSLGLTEAEESQYLSHWHNRTVVPILEASTLACMVARWRDMYDREQLTFEDESKKMVVMTPPSPVPVATKGRSLRSGRTLPDPSVSLEAVLVERESEERSEVGSGGEGDSGDDGEPWVDNESTASSDISDWTREEGIGFLSPVRRTRRLRKKRSLSDSRTSGEEMEEGEEIGEMGESGVVEEEGRRRAAAERGEKARKQGRSRKPPVRSVLDYSVYHPPDWLKSTSTKNTPYFPQVGDIVVYFHQGHDLYVKAVKEERLFPWKPQKMPWQRYRLLPQELCQVKNVHFVVGPPTLCSISLTLLTTPTADGPSTSKLSSEKITFTFKYHDMDNVLEFLVLESDYKKSIQRVWLEGSRFHSRIDGMYWYGEVLGREPFCPAHPSSLWQCYRVKWDDGATDQLSPWDMEPVRREEEEEEESGEGAEADDPQGGWWGEDGEGERILHGLDVISRLDEAAMFLEAVDLDEVPDYCVHVPFPTDLSTIRTRLQNKFYRRKIALLWEVVQVRRNAELYNEERSLIISHARILVRTLCKFITSTTSDPLVHYREAEEEDEEGERAVEEVAVPEVEEYVDNGLHSPPTLPSPLHHHPTPPHYTSVKEDNEEEAGSAVPWCHHAHQLLSKLCGNENSAPFLHPVDTTLYTDYLDVIREPMDLSKIGKKLRNGHYVIPNDIIRDIRLIFSNAKTYNTKGTMVYKRTTEFQAFFETIVLDFLKSCGGDTNNVPLHGTRHALGRLAHHLSSEDVPTTAPIEAHQPWRRSKRQRRGRRDVLPPPSPSAAESESESETESIDVSTPLTPASESSAVTVQSSMQGSVPLGAGQPRDPPSQSHGMTLRERHPVKRVFEDSESEEEQGRGRGGREPIRTRSWSTPHKRQRLSSDSEGDDGEGPVATVTRTSSGRVVKQIPKFS